MDTSRPITQRTKDGEFIANFKSSKAAGKQFGGKNSDAKAIYRCATIGKQNKTGKQKTARGYIWEFNEAGVV